jgi:CysZ protein
MLNAFIAGLTYPFRALVMLTDVPRLWKYVLIPIAVNFVVGVTLYAGLLFAGLRAIDAAVAGMPAWAAIFGALLRALLIVGLLIGTGFVLVRFGVVLGAPWYAQLSNQIELVRNGRQVLPYEAGAWVFVRDLARAVGFEVQKLALVLLVGIGLLLLNLIPVAGTLLATAGGIMLGATVACLDFLDYPLERRLLSFRQKLGLIRRYLPATAGFGLICLGLVSIPFVNLLSIPLCVAAGTLFFCERMQPYAHDLHGR